nr:unnamed protein product [Callosobruchus chinensis]
MKKNKKHRYWVHLLNTRRVYESPFYMKRAKLRAHPDKFIDSYRMSIKSFDELHNGIRDKLRKQNTCMRSSLDTEEKLTITHKQGYFSTANINDSASHICRDQSLFHVNFRNKINTRYPVCTSWRDSKRKFPNVCGGKYKM